jgi:hypothetical protein
MGRWEHFFFVSLSRSQKMGDRCATIVDAWKAARFSKYFPLSLEGWAIQKKLADSD